MPRIELMFASSIPDVAPFATGGDTCGLGVDGADPSDLDLTGTDGVELARALMSLPEPASVDGWTVVDAMAGWERVIRFAQGQQLAWIAELGSRRPEVVTKWARGQVAERDLGGAELPDPGVAQVGDHTRACAQEVGLALDLPRLTAQFLLGDACRLARVLPETLQVLQSGGISLHSARAVAGETSVLPDPEARLVQHRVIEWLADPGAGKTTSRVVQKVRRAVLSADPAAALVRERRAVAGRYVRPRHAIEDGMVSWEAQLPAAESFAAWERIGALATAAKHPGDARTADARRADVLLDLMLGRPTCTPDGRPADPVAVRTWHTDVVVAARTLCGDDDEPGELAGWGPITAGTARRLAGRGGGLPAVWRRLLTDAESGIVRDYGTTRYRPTRSLADFIKARDGRCIAPGCRRPASGGQLDHVRNSPLGASPRPDPAGTTSDNNLGVACDTDHRIKAMPGWHLASPVPGHFVWTTPTGHRYQRLPEPPLERWATSYPQRGDPPRDGERPAPF